MLLNNISLVKLEQEIFEIDEQLKRVIPLQKKREKLLNVKDVLEWYLNEESFSKTHIQTAQSAKTLKWLHEFPFLALYKGKYNSQRLISAYSSEDSLYKYSAEDVNTLNKNGWKSRMHDFLSLFFKSNSKQSTDKD
ncbi:MAG: hypothetical protein ABIG64_09000 [Candidatus Omnitrophota bacterium]